MKSSLKLMLFCGAVLFLAAGCVVNIPLVTVSQEAGQLLNGRTSVSVVYCTDPNQICGE